MCVRHMDVPKARAKSLCATDLQRPTRKGKNGPCYTMAAGCILAPKDTKMTRPTMIRYGELRTGSATARFSFGMAAPRTRSKQRRRSERTILFGKINAPLIMVS